MEKLADDVARALRYSPVAPPARSEGFAQHCAAAQAAERQLRVSLRSCGAAPVDLLRHRSAASAPPLSSEQGREILEVLARLTTEVAALRAVQDGGEVG